MNLRENFFAEEIMDSTLVTSEMKQVWAVNLDLLEQFTTLCETHQLRFFMGFGTLLGAFRHQGFIPWDDDVDLLMPRADFERLKTLYAEVKEPYFLQSSLSDPAFWHRGMIKFRRSNTACIEKYDFYRQFHQGIALEIMPLDVCPDNRQEQKRQAERVGHYQRLLWAKIYHKDYHEDLPDEGTKDLASILQWKWYRLRAMSSDRVQLERKLLEVCRSHEQEKTNHYAIYISFNKADYYVVLQAEDFASAVEMDFENLRLPAPVGFWRCLQKVYGRDFLCYVPKNMRKPHHPAFWSVDESYEVWQQRFQKALKPQAGQRVVLFGTGNMVSDYEKRTGGRLQPEFYVDNDRRKWGTSLGGIPIRSPQALMDIPKEQLHLIICNNYFREIGKQLREMGIRDYFVYTDNFPVLFGTPDKMAGYEAGSAKPYHIGYVQGTFDLFHVGHLNLLRRAKERCEYLIVGVVSDALNQQYKGKKPYISYEDRAAIVGSVRYTDRVICITPDNQDKLQLWEKYHYDCHFSGDDHTGWEELMGALRERGSNVEFFPYTQKISSSKIKAQLGEQGHYGLAASYPCEQLPERLVLYGAGALGLALYRRLLDDPHHKVVFWTDRQAGNKDYEGLPVYPLDGLREHSYDGVVIAVKDKGMAEDIRSGLVQWGIPIEKIFWFALR